MGTQFASRLTTADRKRIVKGIVGALEDISRPAKGRRLPAAKIIDSLSREQQRKFGDAAVGEVLTVANRHGFFEALEKSTVFEDTLKWLKRLRNDAEFNAFKGIIKQYGVEKSVNPVRDLRGRLGEVAKNDDPFRGYATTAAAAILAETSFREIPSKPGESPSQTYGRRLATMHLRDLVRRYINSFVFEFLSKSFGQADPYLASEAAQHALGVSQKSIERVARNVVERIMKEGKLCDTRWTRKAVREELENFTNRKKKPESPTKSDETDK